MTKPSGNKIGRPKKSDLLAVRENRPVGRPKGTAAIINEYRDRMLNSPKSEKVLQKMFEIALNDEHTGQMAAMKLIADRILPVSSFDTVKQSGAMPTISINISGLNEPKVTTSDEQDVIDI